MRHAVPDARIEIVLPRDGPIVEPLRKVASVVTFEPLWVLRRRNLVRLATVELARLPLAFLRAVNRFRRNDLVYINTSVIADHLLAARFFRGKSLVHIHEIPEGPVLTALRSLVRWSDAEIIFNSFTTKSAFSLQDRGVDQVVYNGIARPPAGEAASYDGTRKLRVLMLGRISRIKGQEVLLEAVASLPPAIAERIELRIVGSAFEDQAREQALRAQVSRSGLAAYVSIEDFTANTAPLYRWADIVVVPSRLPESLGRVAIEAMAYGRPPVASAIGGLGEVVEDGVTGWLVPPGRADILAQTLERIITDPASWRHFAAAGQARYEALFSAEAAASAIAGILRRKLGQRSRGAS